MVFHTRAMAKAAMNRALFAPHVLLDHPYVKVGVQLNDNTRTTVPVQSFIRNQVAGLLKNQFPSKKLRSQKYQTK